MYRSHQDVTPIGPWLRQPFLEKNTADVASVWQLDIDERAPVRVRPATWPNAIAAGQERAQPVACRFAQTPLVVTFGLGELGSVDGDEAPLFAVVASRVAVDKARLALQQGAQRDGAVAVFSFRLGEAVPCGDGNEAQARKRTPISSRVHRRVAVEVPRRCRRPRRVGKSRWSVDGRWQWTAMRSIRHPPSYGDNALKKRSDDAAGSNSSVECAEALADALREGLEATPGIEPGCADLQSAT